MTISDREHWERVYSTKEASEASWFEDTPARSLEWIERARAGPATSVLDAGGGASSLAAELVQRGYQDVTVADISDAALAAARAAGVATVQADLRDHDFGRTFDVWHDRAVLHFMVDEDDRARYLATVRRSIAPGGHLVLATFGTDGPEQCSNLPVRRYAREDVATLDGFELVEAEHVDHRTPSGSVQEFLYALLQRDG